MTAGAGRWRNEVPSMSRSGSMRERYAVPAEDQISPAVWARASIGALRTGLVISARGPRAAQAPPTRAPGDPIRACFAALQRGS